MYKLFLAIIIINITTFQLAAQPAYTKFDSENFSYKGTKKEQVQLLLRKVNRWGEVSSEPVNIDIKFLELLESSMSISKEKCIGYIAGLELLQDDIGGSFDDLVSYIFVNGEKVYAKYFVIHDTSTPVYKDKFPNNIDSVTWSWNKKEKWLKKITHVYVTRTGQLSVVSNFSEALRATKFEINYLGSASKGLFLHIELIQPRKYPPGNEVNAPIAPDPGFSNIQYDRLAILYIAASLRRGDW